MSKRSSRFTSITGKRANQKRWKQEQEKKQEMMKKMKSIRLTKMKLHSITYDNTASEKELNSDELFQKLSTNLASSNVYLSKKDITKVPTALHQYPMIGPIQSSVTNKTMIIWSCDNQNCIKNRHRQKKKYRSNYFVSLKLGHDFVLCQDCVLLKEKDKKQSKVNEEQKDVEENEENTEKIKNTQKENKENTEHQSLTKYIASLNMQNIELDEDECFPILREIPRCELINYCTHFGIKYSSRSKDLHLLRKVTKHFILYNRCKNNNRSIDDIERDIFGFCAGDLNKKC